jgi:hypothetical protein
MSSVNPKQNGLPNGSAVESERKALPVRSNSGPGSKPTDGRILTGKQEHCKSRPIIKHKRNPADLLKT